jgi:hypothetical protein
MAAPYGPPWTPRTRGPAPRRSSRYANSHLRVSDAERAAVADQLSKHYADGRLDQAEFNERLDQAMSAKTQFDLGGLFDDLPPIEGSDVVATRRPRNLHPRHYRLLFIIVVVVLAVSVGHALAHLYHPWLFLAVLAGVWILRHDLIGHRRS